MPKEIIERRLQPVKTLIPEYAEVILKNFHLSPVDKINVGYLTKCPLGEVYSMACNLLNSNEVPKPAKKLLGVVVALSRYGFDCRAMPEKREFERLQGGPVSQPQPGKPFVNKVVR